MAKQHTYPQYVKRQNTRLHMRLDETTARELERLSEKTGLNKSEVIRRSIHIMSKKTNDNSLATRAFLAKNQETMKALAALNGVLTAIELDYRRIGSNLNQIAKKANAGDLSGLQSINATIGFDLEKIKRSADALIRQLYR